MKDLLCFLVGMNLMFIILLFFMMSKINSLQSKVDAHVQKAVGKKSDDFAVWLSYICKQYQIAKESDEFKRAKKNASRRQGNQHEK